MKYCIGCKHLDFQRADPGWSTEVTAGIGAHEAELACERGHWRSEVECKGDLPHIEKMMEKAENCPDFAERTT